MFRYFGKTGYVPVKLKPASVAQLDARPTGDLEVTALFPTGSGKILSWRLIMKYFL